MSRAILLVAAAFLGLAAHCARRESADLVEVYDPCADPYENADLCAEAGQLEHEIGLRMTMLTGDPLTHYNLACALRDASYPTEPMLRDIAARTPPWDPVLAYTLELLAEEVSDPAEARAMRAHAGYLMEIRHGTTAEDFASPAPSEGSRPEQRDRDRARAHASE